MITYPLVLTNEEIAFLINTIPLTAHYPEPYNEWAMEIMPEKVVSGGPAFRLKMIAVRQHAKRFEKVAPNGIYPIEVSVGELWFLDAVMSQFNYAQVRMPAGTPMLVLAEKVWNALINAHSSIVDERYLPVSDVKAVGMGMTEDQRARLEEFDRMMGASE